MILSLPVIVTAILFGGIVVHLLCAVKEINDNKHNSYLRTKITELVFTESTGLSIITFLYTPIHWAYISPEIGPLVNIFFAYNIIVLVVDVVFYKEFAYSNCYNYGFVISYRRSQSTFSQKYTHLKIDW